MYSDTKIFLEPLETMAHQVEKLKEDWTRTFLFSLPVVLLRGRVCNAVLKCFKTHIPCHIYMPRTDT